ncbi:helix-turn-helix transcriptional regulator [Paenibacillus cellulositrophicus]|uniref:winged helix-turn-helix transcriptional regulator n=1 Tax=Paenibacillus cellulositrophicus TaxID=562959 RepID=UPI002041106D|nr:helix-turn-helix domain-containing protein [Paenibacillus cellulositrophicus]MCM3001084.1 helix-turn-helix transcriptional regulator [Paenibacillus cellulositrophicus]
MGDRRNKYGLNPDMQACPVETTLDVIGGKWKGIILYQLLEGKKRFNEFRRLNPGITQFMLTLQLRELERDGIIHREIFKEVPPRVEYSLTDFGRTLEPVITSMKAWGESYKERLNENRTLQGDE